MNAALEVNGWTPKSQVRVLADGADGLSNLVSASAGKTTERVLHWFHVSMRLRPIEQMAPKIAMAANDSDAELKQLLTKKLPRIRYQLWHGKRDAALERIEDIYSVTKRLLGSGSVDDMERVRRFRRHMIELRDYLRINWSGLRNYALERRKGRKISSALAESAMKPFGKSENGQTRADALVGPRAPVFSCRFAAPFSTSGWIVCSTSGTPASGTHRFRPPTRSMTAPTFDTVPDNWYWRGALEPERRGTKKARMTDLREASAPIAPILVERRL